LTHRFLLILLCTNSLYLQDITRVFGFFLKPNLSQSKSQPFTTSLRYGFVAAATSFDLLRGRSFVVVGCQSPLSIAN
jgi:hypothetical protein